MGNDILPQPKQFIAFTFALISLGIGKAQDTSYKSNINIPYYTEDFRASDAYIHERCKLDIYYPTDTNNFATIIWFHGGGLSGGEKYIPDALKEKGIAIVAVNYRLHPKVNAPTYIEDAAAGTAWVFKHIDEYGGDPSLIFLSGHSAGGYLTSMIGLDEHWLAKHEYEANNIAGLIPFSGHAITHFTVRKERNIEWSTAIVDELAPLYHVRKDAPPLLLITGDREMELWGRYEENAYLERMMKLVGHTETKLFELDGYGHGMEEPAYPLLIKEVTRITKEKRNIE